MSRFPSAAHLASCRLDHLLHVGDSLETDVEGAQAVGVRAVWLNRNGAFNDTGIEPDYQIATLTDLPALLSLD